MADVESLSEFPRAYLLTFATYGSWLHGVEKGSVDRQHNRVETEFALPDAARLQAMKKRMTGKAGELDDTQRPCVEQAIASVCEHRNWELLAMNVRTNHVHVVVCAQAKPEKVMSDLKAWATRRLREAELIGADEKTWSRHGSTRYLSEEQAVENACRYVIEGQGVDL